MPPQIERLAVGFDESEETGRATLHRRAGVATPHRDPSGEHDRVAAEDRLVKHFVQHTVVVPCARFGMPGKRDRFNPRTEPEHRTNRGRIAVATPVRPRRLFRRNELVARGHNRDPQSRMHQRTHMPDGREGSDRGRAERGSGRQHRVCHPGVLAATSGVGALPQIGRHVRRYRDHRDFAPVLGSAIAVLDDIRASSDRIDRRAGRDAGRRWGAARPTHARRRRRRPADAGFPSARERDAVPAGTAASSAATSAAQTAHPSTAEWSKAGLPRLRRACSAKMRPPARTQAPRSRVVARSMCPRASGPSPRPLRMVNRTCRPDRESPRTTLRTISPWRRILS